MSDYIKLFNTKSEQDAFLSSSGYKEPHISCTANGGNLRYNQSFVGILVGTNGSLRAYIKSSELTAFINERAVHAYSDVTCTELIEGNLTFEVTLTGIDEYYASLGEDTYEIPELDEFYVEDGIITYLEEQEPTEEPEEESGVMPHDGMDPDAGGGEDIVEEEPTDSPEEEVEEEP